LKSLGYLSIDGNRNIKKDMVISESIEYLVVDIVTLLYDKHIDHPLFKSYGVNITDDMKILLCKDLNIGLPLYKYKRHINDNLKTYKIKYN
jgi:hypothetical protein